MQVHFLLSSAGMMIGGGAGGSSFIGLTTGGGLLVDFTGFDFGAGVAGAISISSGFAGASIFGGALLGSASAGLAARSGAFIGSPSLLSLRGWPSLIGVGAGPAVLWMLFRTASMTSCSSI